MDPKIVDMRRELQCPVCVIIPRNTPIYQCQMGHIVCSECLPDLKTCPICKTSYTKPSARNLLAEKCLETVDRSCRYEVLGCDFSSLQTSLLLDHESSCSFKPNNDHGEKSVNIQEPGGRSVSSGSCG